MFLFVENIYMNQFSNLFNLYSKTQTYLISQTPFYRLNLRLLPMPSLDILRFNVVLYLYHLLYFK